MWWTNTLRTSAEGLGTLAENVPPSSTVPSIDAYFEHNMWNPLLELPFHEQANGIFASYLVEIDLAKIAFSCHFALDLLCYKEELLAFCTMIHWTLLPMEFFMFPWHHCHPCVVVFGASLQLSVSRFCTFSRWCFLLSCISMSLPSVTRATLYVPSARA